MALIKRVYRSVEGGMLSKPTELAGGLDASVAGRQPTADSRH
jgi:hypothetical protein